MKLSLEWIQEFVDLSDLSLEEIVEKINHSICETEETISYLPHLENIVPVRILSLEKHPQADKLTVTQVDAGNKKLQIVTNATNLKAGDIVGAALPGTILDGKEIISSELRGILSEGMFCAGKDLGVSDDDSGVMVLNADLPKNSIEGAKANLSNIKNEPLELGVSLREQLGFRDTIIDIDNKSITHRPDLWSHFGFARELAAQLSKPIRFNPLDANIDTKEFNSSLSPVRVQENTNCIAYYVTPIQSIKVSPSSMKFRSRLIKSGIKSISNVVDVSNYLLLECGQPTHFFDRKRLKGGEFEVSFAKSGESFRLLDETDPKLTDDTLLIRNQGMPVAIAGVMGGMESAVYSDTEDLVLESAIFRREDIRKSIKRTGIRSDAAIRYEKGLNSYTCIPIIHRTVQLLRENGNPDLILGAISGFNHGLEKKVTIDVTLDFLQKKLGKQVSATEVEDILTRLGFVVESNSDKVSWKVLVPSYRHNYDVTIAEDLVEEIGRTIGYANIATSALSLSVETPIENVIRDWEKKWKTTLSLKLSYHEVFNYSFASPKEARFERDREDREIVILQNEMPEEHSVLRTSIYPSLLRSAVVNQDRFDKFGLFEMGRTYDNSNRDKDGLPKEERNLGILFMGAGRTQSESQSEMEEDFVNLRTSIESILNSWNMKELIWSKISRKYFHPNAGFELTSGGIVFAEMGILHNREADDYDLRKRPILAKIQMENFIDAFNASKKNKIFQAPSHFPQGHLDISLVLDKKDNTDLFSQKMFSLEIPELEEVWVHDVFQGGNLPEDKQSVTYRVSLVPQEKTFTQDRLKELTEILITTAQNNGFQVR